MVSTSCRCNMLQKSLIDSSSDEGLKPDDMSGMIELKNVVFRFPSREEVKVTSIHLYIFLCMIVTPLTLTCMDHNT